MLLLRFTTNPHPPPSFLPCITSTASSSSSFCPTHRSLFNNGNKNCFVRSNVRTHTLRVFAMSDSKAYKMNLNQYLVTLERPLGIRFALTADGNIIVHSLTKGGNAERSRIIMVGDTLKKLGDSSQNKLVEIKDVGDTQKVLNEQANSFSLVLERPTSPFPIQLLHKMIDLEILFNRGRVPIISWSKTLLASNLQPSSESSGNSGFVVFNSKFLTLKGSQLLGNQNQDAITYGERNFITQQTTRLACIFSGEACGDGEWAHGSFPLEEYIQALDRSKDEMYYNHSLGMRYSKITEQLFVGSCIQTEADVETLSIVEGITAVLNFQSGNEAENWGINVRSINDSCQRNNILMINYSIRDRDSYDLRKKLPFCVGLLLRLLRKNHRVFVTCTSGFDRSPACVIAYLHWMTDVSLHAAYTWVTGMHTCRPDRPAIAWATWDLIAMVERGKHDGPPTHAVTFVWNGHEEDDVTLVGDFTANWKEPLKAVYQGARHEVEVKLPQGKYYYKFIVNGEWMHSTASPEESDDRGNINNIIVIGETASIQPSVQHQPEFQDANVVKVIERPLNETERFMLAKAARCIAFSICPIRLTPK
ncbi:phosphoglucan phosphatase LSF1, chloroplastic isoform X1 [Arachis hypogaea]|uniref:phosphoglucan phosphatase LSF1, chloroplastic isoform X1 n=1 Tax=Arachis hypogaea TaxID=3818 RepID=UPI000DED1D84|nr:phosphoglucan phosphatase LSF1, chloroplastic isoform X1 [Arachis hypogaea]QHO47434.1 Phosphoglucan phosphatase LSF1 [Arachis hypogaea]